MTAVLAVLCILSVYWIFFYEPVPYAGAAPQDPYIELYPGERAELNEDVNESCLNQVLPRGIQARLVRHEYEGHRINFTHVEQEWEQYVVVQNLRRQNTSDPDKVRVHERTIEGCRTLDRDRRGETPILNYYGQDAPCTVIVGNENISEVTSNKCDVIYEYRNTSQEGARR